MILSFNELTGEVPALNVINLLLARNRLTKIDERLWTRNMPQIVKWDFNSNKITGTIPGM